MSVQQSSTGRLASCVFGWVDAGKRKFFAVLLLLIVVEVVVVVLIARAEHDRFPPLPPTRQAQPARPQTTR